MQCILDLDRQRLVKTAGGDDDLTSVAAKRGPVGIIAVKVVQLSSVITAAIADLQLKFVVKQPGQFDQTPLVSTSDFEWVDARKQYEAEVNFITDKLNILFGVQSDPVTISGGVAATNVITTSDPHGLAVGDRIWFPELDGGAPLVADEDTKYYVKTVPSTTTLTISETEDGTTLDITVDIASGSLRKDPEDVASVDLAAEIGWRYDSGDPWIPTENEVELELRNNIIRETDGEPEDAEASAAFTWLSENAVLFSDAQSLSQSSKVQALQNQRLVFTALTGGGAGALDSLVTAGGVVTAPSLFDVVIGTEYQKWLFRAGTDAEDGTGIVRPDDYHASTNAFVFERVL